MSQIRIFKETVARDHSSVFAGDVIGLGRANRNEKTLGDRLKTYLPRIETQIETIRRLSGDARTHLLRYEESFRRQFPDFAWSGTIYFTLSLCAFDGALRRVNRDLALLFGLDRIAELHGRAANLGPLFHHELFHLYHEQISPRDDFGRRVIYASLWNEGLAVYVSHILNPGASFRELLLPDTLVKRATEKRRPLAREIREKLDSTSDSDYHDFFLSRIDRMDIPARSGYYIGFLVAKRLARSHSLRELVRLHGRPLREKIASALGEMEAEP